MFRVFNEGNEVPFKLYISDNGTGKSSDPNKPDHYGLAIMQERSCSLGGEISIEKRKTGGTEVLFQFIPKYAKPVSLQTQSA